MTGQKAIFNFLLCLLLTGPAAFAQTGVPDSNRVLKDDLVISYALRIESNKKNGIAESYNGAIKTIFLKNDQARSRLVSLMRVQSIFYFQNGEGTGEKITVVKESGKDSYKKSLTKDQWKQLNKKYDGATYEFTEDSIQILDYTCKKAFIHLKDGKKITAFYTKAVNSRLFSHIEPAFAGLPGLVLQYEYENKDAKFIYTASDISFSAIGTEIYKIP